jgi:release factor glutamine methyltransferase
VKEGTASISHVLHGGIQKLQDSGIDQPRRRRYAALIERRVKREPVAYITGCKEFRSLNFTLTPDVLIPRPETEILLDEILSACTLLTDRKDHLRILELGTGSGILAVSIAKNVDTCTIFATDISYKKIDVARNNSRLHKVDASIRFFVGDLYHPITIREDNDRFDCVVFNPPYLSHDDWKQAQPEIQNYEPIDSLVAGDDGLFFYRSLIPGVAMLLQPGGYLALEIGGGQAESITTMLGTAGVYREVCVVQDLAGIDRVICAHL